MLGAFLVYTGLQFVLHTPKDFDPRKNLIFRMARRWLPLAEPLASDGDRLAATPIDPAALYGRGFFVRENGRTVATGLFLVVLVIECTDLLFAIDSVPAVFGITRDTFIVFSSNLLAILGLRALYFLLAGALDLFRYLHLGLAAILVFVGLKMNAETFWPHPEGSELVPVWASLATIGGLLAASIAASLLVGKRE
jgi:tellurite resistance protein TerC